MAEQPPTEGASPLVAAVRRGALGYILAALAAAVLWIVTRQPLWSASAVVFTVMGALSGVVMVLDRRRRRHRSQ